jgi:hypothetical protein
MFRLLRTRASFMQKNCVNETNRLGNMMHFPAVVNASATLHVLLTGETDWPAKDIGIPRRGTLSVV